MAVACLVERAAYDIKNRQTSGVSEICHSDQEQLTDYLRKTKTSASKGFHVRRGLRAITADSKKVGFSLCLLSWLVAWEW